DRARPEERRRNELYRQYYEELQRRYDTERPVDCSVIALEDVGRARTPFAIIITQQHQLHRSCTVNILFGTPQAFFHFLFLCRVNAFFHAENAKILSLFNSGSSPLSGTTGVSQSAPQSHSYSSHGSAPSQNPARAPMPGLAPGGSQGYGIPMGRLTPAAAAQRPPASSSGINFDNPSVQKALDTLIQSGPSLNNLVGPGSAQPLPQRSAPSMGQGPPMSMYPRHY
ncbi:hypothetical protein XENOCAPTIV_008132, partial [Xenoophorus captivus]